MAGLPEFEWLPSTAERFDYALNVLPPREFNANLVLVGEAMDHGGPNYAPRYTVHKRVGDVCTVGSRPITVAEYRAIERGRL